MRGRALAHAGYLVRRYTWRALLDPDGVAVEIAGILAERLAFATVPLR